MIDLAMTMTAGTGVLAGAGFLAGHAWRTRRLAFQFDSFAEQLNAIESAMYTHDEPEERPLEAPLFDLPGIDGRLVSLQRLLALGKPVLLVFINPAGEVGRALLTTIGAWQGAQDAPITVVGIAPGIPSITHLPACPDGVTNVLYQGGERRVAANYGVVLTPAAVLIRPNGALATSPVVGIRGIESLLDSIARAATEAAEQRKHHLESNAPMPGVKAPRLLLPDLDDVDQELLPDGTSRLLLFWSSNCGYCDQLVPDLQALAASWPASLPAVTIVSRGSAEEVRAQHLGYRTLLDHDLSASEAFGVSGTPAAIAVGADGLVTSPVARGVRGVRDLLGLDG